MLSPPKPLDEIHPNLVCEFDMNGACNVKKSLAPPPGALKRGQKVKYHLISITKSISKIFIPKFVCVFSQMKDKNISNGFFILSPGSCPRVGLGGTKGQKSNSVLLSVRFAISS